MRVEDYSGVEEGMFSALNLTPTHGVREAAKGGGRVSRWKEKVISYRSDRWNEQQSKSVYTLLKNWIKKVADEKGNWRRLSTAPDIASIFLTRRQVENYYGVKMNHYYLSIDEDCLEVINDSKSYSEFLKGVSVLGGIGRFKFKIYYYEPKGKYRTYSFGFEFTKDGMWWNSSGKNGTWGRPIIPRIRSSDDDFNFEAIDCFIFELSSSGQKLMNWTGENPLLNNK